MQEVDDSRVCVCVCVCVMLSFTWIVPVACEHGL